MSTSLWVTMLPILSLLFYLVPIIFIVWFLLKILKIQKGKNLILKSISDKLDEKKIQLLNLLLVNLMN
ncbi:hypothetical protein ACFVRR_22495 [Gottfriedia sp. NPDC057948]|uniref:hypothetical protein n=1 Tax=Gottfriedia sp. NPDC057948 TaxID=3346287 RepID=UPI0036DD57E4